MATDSLDNFSDAQSSPPEIVGQLQKRISYLENALKGYEGLKAAYEAAQWELRELKAGRVDGKIDVAPYSPKMRDTTQQHDESDDGYEHHGQMILGELPGTCRYFGNASPAYSIVCLPVLVLPIKLTLA